MRQFRVLSLLLIASILLAAFPHSARAAQATPVPSQAAEGRRFVSVATRSTTYFPGVSPSFGFGNNIHEPGLGCVYYPPELELQFLLLQRDDAGYTATVIFGAPIQPLSELNGKPVTHDVKLTFKPPKGDAVVVDLSLTTGKLTVKHGKTSLDEDAENTTAGLLADRLIFSVPETLGIEPDWTVSAIVVIAGEKPICDQFPVYFHQTATPPVTVGSLTGDDPAGTITFPTFGVVPGPKLGAPLVSGKMPAGSKITSLHLEQDSQDALVVVLTMNADIAKLAESDPTGRFTVAIELAAPEFFGVIYPYSLDWIWTPSSGPMPATARVFIPGYPIAIGSVPVTVDGKEMRFAFSGYDPVDNLRTFDPDPLSMPFGDFAVTFVAPSTLAGAMCICPEDAVPPTADATAVIYEDFQYEIIGNMLSVTRLSTNSVAYGWIDRDGRFLADNDEELYRGVIKIIPNAETYDIGVQGRYLEMLDQQPEQIASSGARNFASADHGSTAIRAMTWIEDRTSTRTLPDDLRGLLDIWAKYYDLESTDWEPTEAQNQNLLDFFRFAPRREDYLDEYENYLLKWQVMQDQSHGMSVPSSNFGISVVHSQSVVPPSAASSSGLPFPLPIAAPTSEFQPTMVNPDWAIRAGSFFYATKDNPYDQMPALTGPWVDSRLLMTESAASSTSATVVVPASPELVLLSRRGRLIRRLSRRTAQAIRTKAAGLQHVNRASRIRRWRRLHG